LPDGRLGFGQRTDISLNLRQDAPEQ
jgi:hypothetical protein